MMLNAGGFSLLVAMIMTLASGAQTEPILEDATRAILKAFQSHDLVMLGETHGNKQEYDWLRSLVDAPEFADRVDDIVMEFGNSLYQEAVDRYVRGDEILLERVEGAWLDTVASVGPPSPVYASLYHAVRETNMKRKRQHHIRVLCGDPNIDWTQVKEGKDILPYLRSREQSYAQVVKNEVLAKHRRALLIMGVGHFLRHFDVMASRKEFDIEQQLRAGGANPYVIVSGTNTTGGVNQVDHRLDSWPVPIIVSLANNWLGELPAVPVVRAGRGPSLPGLKLRDAADALLYLGPQNDLVTVPMPRSELEGTRYGKEIERRMTLQMTLER
jgi:hypothetical protein